jgi:lipoate-protein ligase A
MAFMEEKIKDGKLLKIEVNGSGPYKIVMISGDFFMYPEEGVFIIEKALSGLEGDEGLPFIEKFLHSVVRENSITLYGIDEKSIARLYKGASDVESH